MQDKIKTFGKVSLVTLVIGTLLLTGFRLLYPNTPMDAAPMTLIIFVAIILSSLFEIIWQKIMKKRGENDSAA